MTKGASFCSQGDEWKLLSAGPKPEQVDSLLKRSGSPHLGHSVLERNSSLTGCGGKAKKNTPLQWDRWELETTVCWGLVGWGVDHCCPLSVPG